jgi:hypothetical protein
MKIKKFIPLKALSPVLVSKAMATFDKATMIVVGVCWGGALMMMAFALYTVSMTVSARHATDAALIAEPSLPKIVRTNMDVRTAQIMLERLQKHYPDINFALQPNQVLKVSTNDGAKFHQWLTALSYIDTIAPEWHWSIQEFCVGKCSGNDLMRAMLTGEHISFEAPSISSK